MSAQFKRYVVMISNFGHDINGNPIAEHAVYGYREEGQNTSNPSALLYETKRRQQVGYGKHDGWARSALAKAGAPAGLEQKRIEGSRSEGFMKVVFDVPAEQAK